GPSPMKRFVTAQLAACAIALPALRAAADENPPPPPASAETAPAARSSVSTTVVVAAPVVVSTGHLVPDLFLNLFALGVQVEALQDGSSCILSIRGQTDEIGDRDGDGLNLNLGVGIGGLSINYHDEFA